MKAKATTVFCVAAAMLASAPLAFAAQPNQTEPWNSGIAGWTRWDPLNHVYAALTNTAGWLEISFKLQMQTAPESHIVRAEAGASSGYFTGDYRAAAITNVAFRFLAQTHQPDQIRLYFYSQSQDDWWYYDLAAPTAGVWQDYAVTMDYDAGWKMDGGNAGRFRTALRDVTWIGIQITRNTASPEKQVYGLDDFAIHGADRTKDGDGDGMNDWAEFVAGTNPKDPNEYLGVTIDPENGITLRWRSVGTRSYGVWRTTNLLVTPTWLTKVSAGVLATPPVNVFNDTDATGMGPYYYRIEVEQ